MKTIIRPNENYHMVKWKLSYTQMKTILRSNELSYAQMKTILGPNENNPTPKWKPSYA